jgi:assimilatory nitrate reductase catalytic subunit
MLAQVARRMGYGPAFEYAGPAAVFREHAALSGFENGGRRAFDISALAGISDAAYDRLPPVQWPIKPSPPGRAVVGLEVEARGTARLFADGRYYTPSGRARFVAVAARPPVNAPDAAYPLVLNTGRVRDHWHTMTRTGKSPRLSAHLAEPHLEIHPADAGSSGVGDGALVRVESRWGRAWARARLTDQIRPGCVFVPMHWNDHFAAFARIGAVVNPETDPVSGQSELKHTPVRVALLATAWEGFLLTRSAIDFAALGGAQSGSPPWLHYRVKGIGFGYWRYELAGPESPPDWTAAARALLADAGAEGEWIEFADRGTGRHRVALLRGGRLQSCLFIARHGLDLPARGWLADLFARPRLAPEDRSCLLAGRPANGVVDGGPVVCACFQVGREAILAAARGGAVSVAAIGERLKAGTNCGACRTEIRALLPAA